MVMHARKPQRLLSDGYHQSHQYQNSKYSSSKRDYEREANSRSLTYTRDHDSSPVGGSLNNDSPRDRDRDRDRERDRERERERDRDRYSSSAYTLGKMREKERSDRDYKKEKYSDSLRSPKRSRSERDSDHRNFHDRRMKLVTLVDKRSTPSDDRERERDRDRIERDRERERDRDRLRDRERDRSSVSSGCVPAVGAANSSNASVSGTLNNSVASTLVCNNAGVSGLTNTTSNTACTINSSQGCVGNASSSSVVGSNDRDRVNRVGDWSEHVSSSGKKYYYNCKTEVSQWEKPREWIEKESSRVLPKDQLREYREKEREREREREERYTSSAVNRSTASSSYGKHSGSSGSNKNNSRGRWQTHETPSTAHRRRFDGDNLEVNVSPGDSTPTSEASYSNSNAPIINQQQLLQNAHAANNGAAVGNVGSGNRGSSLSGSSTFVPSCTPIVANEANSDAQGQNLSCQLPRMVGPNTAANHTVSTIVTTSNHQQQQQPLYSIASSNSSSSSSSSSANSMSSPSLTYSTHGASSSLISSQATTSDLGMVSSNTPGPPSAITHLPTNLHSQQQQVCSLAQKSPHQQNHQNSMATNMSPLGGSSGMNVPTSLAGLPKILSQITGIKSIEHNDLNPQKALQTINNALMMQQQNRQLISGTTTDLTNVVGSLREHALNSPLFNVGNLAHPVHASPLSGIHINHNTHGITGNSHIGRESGVMNTCAMLSSTGNVTQTGDGPPTPTQELEVPISDHRKYVGLNNTGLTSTPTSAVSSLQSVMASSQSGRAQGPNLTPTLAKYFRADLISHVTGWPSEILEKTIQKLSEEAHILGDLQCSKVSAELKCARSLVRITEITATLQEQKIMYLRQQIRRLEDSKSENSFMSSDDL
ncbi:WW domain-containing adapter protein with coiled-coil homolog [Anopheles darlingi]|uniref:WW domain-containing adapter protein with coiled-coil homolog n=1 Tax=Anopheles darlingi TaxID=43151 RepID=UPI00210014AF|nr:WW domain-containing adapter protein with coiled-coil homolog [Anopheles darlingi]